MNLLTLLYVFCLFYVFIPGNIIKLPAKLGKLPIILIHAFVFTVILSCTYGLVESLKIIDTFYSIPPTPHSPPGQHVS